MFTRLVTVSANNRVVSGAAEARVATLGLPIVHLASANLNGEGVLFGLQVFEPHVVFTML